MPERLRAALVTRVPGVALPAATVAEIERAGRVLAARGWEVEETEAPELDRVNEIWGKLLMSDFEVGIEDMRPVVRPVVLACLKRIVDRFDPGTMTNTLLHNRAGAPARPVVGVADGLHRRRRPDVDVHETGRHKGVPYAANRSRCRLR